MINVDKKFFCYSVFSPEYDLNSLEIGLLSKVRSDFFKSDKKQKNQVTKEVNGKKYHYFYSFEKGKPANWKKILNGKLLEKSRVNKDNTYSILYQDENKNLLKISYFNTDHDWLKTEYFKNNRKIIFKILNNGSEILVSEQKNGNKDIIERKIYSFNTLANEYGNNAFDGETAEFFCLTNFGRLSYFDRKKINKVEKTKKIKADKNLMNDNKKNDSTLNNNIQKVHDLNENLNHEEPLKNDITETYFYIGDTTKNLRDGFGRTVTNSGKTVYEGFYKNDKKNGFGVHYYKSGKVSYVGNFFENERNNLGVAFNESGNVAQLSIWKNGQPNNLSTFFDEKGNILVLKNQAEANSKSEFINCDFNCNLIKVTSLKNNKVTLIDENGSLLYNGEVENNLKNGFGTEYTIDGNIKYRGEFKNDLYNGKGVLFLENGHKIEGNFVDGKVNGFATELDDKCQKVYEGDFIDNLYEGKGKLYLFDGSFFEGDFKGSNLIGIVKKFNENNDLIYEGNIFNNEYSGYGTLFFNNKKVYEGDFKNNIYNGFGRLFENGKCIYSGNFLNGKRCGFGTSFNEIGQKSYIGNWNEDKYNGIGMLFEDENQIYVGNFKDSKKSGRVNVIYKEQIIKEGIFEDDNLTYVKEYDYPSKSVSYIGNIYNNEKCGMGCQFNEYGEKKFEGIFEDGQLKSNMRVHLKEIEPLRESLAMKDTEYEKFRFGTDFAVEKDILGGVFSGELSLNKPNGKGTILYSDHRYTGSFCRGLPKGKGIIYKNNGLKIEGIFLENPTNESKVISFDFGIFYNYVETN